MTLDRTCVKFSIVITLSIYQVSYVLWLVVFNTSHRCFFSFKHNVTAEMKWYALDALIFLVVLCMAETKSLNKLLPKSTYILTVVVAEYWGWGEGNRYSKPPQAEASNRPNAPSLTSQQCRHNRRATQHMCAVSNLCPLFRTEHSYHNTGLPSNGPIYMSRIRRLLKSRSSEYQCLSTAASSIRYSTFFGGSAMSAQHTRSTGLLCGRPVALELSTRQLERSEFWQKQLQTSAGDAFIYAVLKHLAY